MKKLILIALALVLLISATSCTLALSTEVLEEKVEQHLTPEDPPAIIDDDTPKLDDIGANAAKRIAREAAGLSEEEVIFDFCELDIDNGIKIYEVGFHNGKTEYEVDVRADNGEIVSFERDND